MTALVKPGDDKQGKALYDAAAVPIFGVDLKGSIAELNAAAVALFGAKSKGELLGKDVVETYVADEDRAEARVRLTEALGGNATEGKPVKVTLLTRTGRKQVALKLSSNRGPDGRVSGAAVVAQDMGELRNLVGGGGGGGSGSDHLAGALEATGSPIFCVDTEGRVLEWSSKVEKVTGCFAGQASGQDFVGNFIIDAHQKAVRKALDQARRGLDVARFEVQLKSASEPRDALLSFCPWRTANGTIIGAVGVCEDVTEMDRRLAEAEWVRQTISELLDRANAPVLSLDPDGQITEWNQRFLDLTGFEKDQMVGKKLVDQVAEGDRQTCLLAIQCAIAGDLGPPVPLHLKVTGGGSATVVAGMSPQFSVQGKVIGVLCVTQAIPDGAH